MKKSIKIDWLNLYCLDSAEKLLWAQEHWKDANELSTMWPFPKGEFPFQLGDSCWYRPAEPK